ncbi:MAG: hypothetical protein AB7P12_10520 [Alphaproteobacteria bacterium]
MSIPLPRTPDGRVYRYSPNEKALPRHFVLGEVAEGFVASDDACKRMKLPPRSKQTVCPYSGVIADDHDFTHPDDVKAATKLVEHAARADIDDAIHGMFRDLERKFSASKFVKIKAGPRSAPRPRPRFARRDLLRELVCDHCGPWTSFCNGLKRDGFVLAENEEQQTTELRRMLPESADVAAADDEVHALLRDHGFTTPLGHLQQAIEAHSRDHWAAANSQLRSFLEGLLDEIAGRLAPDRAANTPGGHGRRALLAALDPPFLSRSLNEWRDDQKAGLINGLFNRLHAEGSHPGLSDEEDSTFRLHTVLIVARLLLRRFAVMAQ